MEYRGLGRTGLEVSAISLGTEYLIDLPREHVVGVIREALAGGVNYFDLFFAQPEFRDNMGAAFAGHRDNALLTAHLGSVDRAGQQEKTRDARLAGEFFEDALRRYRTDFFDVLFVHNCDGEADYREVMRRGGLMDLGRRMKREGKARFVGFSSHTVSTSMEAIATGDVDVLMFPVNLAANAVPGKRELFAECAKRGVGLVAMKPYAGGKLLHEQTVLRLENWHSGGGEMEVKKSLAVTSVQCLSYALAQVGVSTTVPGCKDKGELAAALSYFDAGPEERDFSAAVAAFETYVAGECVYCNHCLPCSSNIDIAATIRLLETAGKDKHGRVSSARALNEAGLLAKAAECVECGACVERCPFGVDAQAKIREAAKLGRR